MDEITIYHNPRCSKGRSACQLVAEHGVAARIINYLETPPDIDELRALLAKLGVPAADLVRRGEAVFKENYAGKTPSEDSWFATNRAEGGPGIDSSALAATTPVSGA